MKFSKEELDFIKKNVGKEVPEEVTIDELLDEIWDAAAEVEAWEENHLDELTEEGRIAVSLYLPVWRYL